MDADKDTQKAARHACNDDAGACAPRVVIEALLTLTAGQLPAHGLAQRVDEGGHTTWRALWLVGDHLAYAEADKDVSDWSLARHDQGNDEDRRIAGWSRPLRDISRLVVTGISAPGGPQFGNELTWEAVTAIEFADGTTVSLPLFDDARGRRAEAVEAMREAVRDAWAGS